LRGKCRQAALRDLARDRHYLRPAPCLATFGAATRLATKHQQTLLPFEQSGVTQEYAEGKTFMQIQVHSDNHIEGSARLVEWVSASVADKLDRFDDEITRVVVHLNDENGIKAGSQDKRCQIEARPKGLQPISVTHKAESLDLAVEGAIDKLGNALNHQFGKLRSKRVTGPAPVAEEAVEGQDALLEEDFLADEQLRSS